MAEHNPSVFVLRGEVDGALQTFPLTQSEVRVGATADNDVVLDSQGVSRRHAIVRCSDSVVAVEDLGSKNGTHVNGARIQQAKLAPGDSLRVGSVLLQLELVDSEDLRLAIDTSSKPSGDALEFDTSTKTDLPARAHEAGAWLACLDGLADRLIGSFDPIISEAITSLAEGLGCSSVLYCQWRGTGDLLGIGAWGDDLEEARNVMLDNLFRRMAEAASAGPILVSGQLEGQPPLLWAIAGRPGEDPRGLLLSGGFTYWKQAEPLLRVVLRMLLHAEPDPIHLTVSDDAPHLPELVLPPEHVVGRATSMVRVYEQLRQLTAGDIPVLIVGETGTGKEHVARILHLSGKRSRGPFVAVNCAAIPTELLESELFGIEKGVATGVDPRAGKFRQAERGVVLLDEIAELPLALQAKLLRAVQEKEIHPLGGMRPVPVDVQIIASTNADLERRVREGRFRADLYYRLAGYTLNLPLLRERREDIPLLVERLVRKFANEVGKPIRGVTVKALRALMGATWEGNVRELEHEVRRLVYLCQPGQPIDSTLLSERVLAPTPTVELRALGQVSDLKLDKHIAELERHLIVIALARTRGNRSKAAKLLGISRNGLALKLERLNIA